MSPCIIFTYHSDFVWRLKVTRDIHHKSSRRERGRHIQDCELNILIFGILRASFNITFLEYRLSRSRDDRSRWEWAWRHSPHKCHRVFNNGDHIRTLEIFMENFIKFVSSFYYSKTPLKCKTTTLRNRVGQQVKSTSTDFIAQALTTSSKVSAASKNLIQVENLVQILPVHFMSWFRLDHSCSQSAWSMFTLFTVSVFGLLDPHLGPSFPLLVDFLLSRHSSNHFRE